MIRSRKMLVALLGLDIVSTIVVFNLVSHFRLIGAHLILAPLFAPAAALVFALYLIDGYRTYTDMTMPEYISLHIIAGLSALAFTLLLTFAGLRPGYELQSSRAVIAISFLILIPATLAYRRVIHQRTVEARKSRSVLFVGDRASWEAFESECERMTLWHPRMFIPLGSAPVDGGDIPLAAVLDDLQSGALSVEAIVLRESNLGLPPDTAQRLAQLYFDGVPTYTLELFHQVYWKKIPLYRLNLTWLFQEGFRVAREPVFERLKRASDLLLSAFGLLIASPIIAAACVAIWLDDRGPIWFVQSRIGRNHVPFRILKLRTMRASAEVGDKYTKPGDARITRVGHFLRASRLDELPQLWNVLRGDMSLIGPRAEWDRLVEDYERAIPCYRYRHLVKPGVTGWAQVNYRYGASVDDTVRKLEYDLYYIRHFSFVLDASIVLKTIQTMLRGQGR